MTQLPFFISAPRTRSSVLFELLHPYLERKHGLKNMKGHTEYFLMQAVWAEFYDARNKSKFDTQMMPMYKNNNMSMHYVYPPVYPDVETAIHDKIAQLKLAKQEGNEFNVKGTIQCAKNPHDILDFYKDRKIVITKRRSMVDLIASTLFAISIKSFHARPSNKERYLKLLEQPILLTPELLQTGEEIVDLVIRLWNIESLANKMGIHCVTTYYEDLDSESAIFDMLTNIIGSDEWIDFLPADYENKIPSRIDKDYSKLIINYDELKNMVDSRYEKIL